MALSVLHWSDRYPLLKDDPRFQSCSESTKRLFVFALEWSRVHDTNGVISKNAVEQCFTQLSDYPTDADFARFL